VALRCSHPGVYSCGAVADFHRLPIYQEWKVLYAAGISVSIAFLGSARNTRSLVTNESCSYRTGESISHRPSVKSMGRLRVAIDA
jgi:hypothetical protein